MTFSQAIMDIISDDRYEAHYVFQELRKKWPQINEQTRIGIVDSREVQFYVAETFGVTDWMKDAILVPIWNWQKVKAAWMPSKYVIELLDDPDERWKYTVRLWKASILTPTYWLWRKLGTWLHRPAWTKRGMELQPNPKAQMPIPKTETLKLETYRWQIGGLWDVQGELTCGYSPVRDTFFVRRGQLRRGR